MTSNASSKIHCFLMRSFQKSWFFNVFLHFYVASFGLFHVAGCAMLQDVFFLQEAFSSESPSI